jgi:hypothetical protein
LDSENVVVGREHVKGTVRSVAGNRNLRVVDSGEVAGTRWLVLFWLKRKGVRVDTWHWGTGVVVERLDLVEVLTTLLLESVLAVQDQLEGRQWTNEVFIPLRRTFRGSQQWRTDRGWRDKAVRGGNSGNVGRDSNWSASEVPQVGTNVSAPNQFLDWVVVGQSDLLGRSRRTQGVRTSVLDLFDQVFVTLLRESSALFSVEVDVVTPNLEGGEVVAKITGQVKVQTDFVVLQGNQWQGQSWVSVEEEDQWQEDSARLGRRRHFTVAELLGFVQVQFSVQSPPFLVVLVDSLTTDGQFNVLDRSFRGPRIQARRGNGSVRRQFNVHVTDQITVSGDRDGNTATRSGGTVNSLFDVFHRKVGVAFVNRLEESDFWVTSQVDILGAISDELHKTSGHSVCFCTIYQDFFFR